MLIDNRNNLDDKPTMMLCVLLIAVLLALTILQFGFGGSINVPTPEGGANLRLTPQNLCCEWECDLCPTEAVAMPTHPDVPGFVPATIADFATRPEVPTIERVATTFIDVTAPPAEADPIVTATFYDFAEKLKTPGSTEEPTLPPTVTRIPAPKLVADCWPMQRSDCLPPLNVEFK